jgi:putative membrane protein
MRPAPPDVFAFEPLYVVVGVVAVVVYAASARAHPRGARPLVFGAGVALVVGALNSPLEHLAEHSLLSAHLLQNAMIADWAPPALILGLSPAMRASFARACGRPLLVATSLPVALALWLCAWYLVHLPLPFDAALRHPIWLNLEHAVLIGAGLIFWWPVIAAAPRRNSTASRLAYLLAGSLLSGPLGFVYLFMVHPLYGYYVHQPRVWSIGPLWDQHLGGIVMNVEQSIVFFVAVAWLFVRWIAEDEDARTQPERNVGAAAEKPTGQYI